VTRGDEYNGFRDPARPPDFHTLPAYRVSEVGNKFGRWLDLTFMQRHLDARDVP